MGYWKWLQKRVKEFIIGIIPRKVGTPYQEYMIGCLTSLLSFVIGFLGLLITPSDVPYLFGLSIIGFFIATHGWYRGHVS